MKRTLLSALALGPALLLGALLVPGAVAAAGPISTTACAPGVTPGTVTCNLWAKTGTLLLPGTSVPIWGFAETAGGSPTVPGPVLVVDQDDVVTVNLANNLTRPTSILFSGQAMVPDQAGVAPGSTTHYTFTASAPGTQLYEAGLIPGSQYQVAMGLYGTLIVRPTGHPTGLPGQAYGGAATTFDDEALVVLSEIDPTLNTSLAPWTVDLRAFAPTFSLINGMAYTNTAPSIGVTSGNQLLLRYANAGIQHHSIGVLGLRQAVLAADGSQLPYPRTMVAETIAPGQSADVLISLPEATAASTKYALYDASMALNNSNASGIGGMLALIDAGASGSASGDTVGPITSGATLTETAPGSHLYTLTATVDETTTGLGTVSGAEYRVDSTSGTPTAMTAVDLTFNGVIEAVTSASGAIDTTPWTSGTHTIYVRGRDAAGNWGAYASVAITLDTAGPTTSALVVNPNVTNGFAAVALSATGDETATGGSNVTAAEYFIDATGANGAGTPMTPNRTAPVVSLAATIAAGDVNALGDGAHTIHAHSRDAGGAWGPFVTATLTLDRVGPTTSGVAAAPSPSNGRVGVSTSNPSVRVTASFSDALGTVATGEGFIDTVGGTGTGFPFVATDGLFNSASETGYADIPLSTILTLSESSHTIHVRGRDAAGNWGATSSVILVVDRTGPTTSGVTLVPTAANAQAVAIGAAASDVATGNSNIVAGESFIDAAGTSGTGTAMSAGATVPATTLSGSIPASQVAALGTGNHTIRVHARDAAGNWGPLVTATLLIDRTNPTFASISLSPNPTAGATSVTLTVAGSADVGGSGVTGGEWWFGTTNPAPGAGTAFNGLTASVPTAVCPGTYTVRARIHDGAGNWSSGSAGVRSTTLTVTRATPVAPAIFADGFELGASLPCAWTSRSTATASRLSATPAAALAGTIGLQAEGDNTNYVQFNFATLAVPAAPIYDARFSFNPNGNASTGHDILRTASATGFGAASTLGRVRYRQLAGQGQVQIQVGTANTNTTWTNINSAASNTIEIVWQAAASGGPDPGTLALHVNGALAQTLATPSTGSVLAIRFGSVTAGSSATLEYFDGFDSRSSASPLIGP